MSKATEETQKAINALHLEVPESIARDVGEKVLAALLEKENRITTLEQMLKGVRDRLKKSDGGYRALSHKDQMEIVSYIDTVPSAAQKPNEEAPGVNIYPEEGA